MIEVLVWDSPQPLPTVFERHETVVFWRRYDTDGLANAISIPRYVEDHSACLRNRYLAWVYDFGETMIRGKRVVEHLELRSGVSAWWMSLLTEKCNFEKSPQIDDAIRLLALSDWMDGKLVGRVVLVSPKEALAECLRAWCSRDKIDFEWRRCAEEGKPVSSFLRTLYAKLPNPLQALFWIALHVRSYWSLRNAGFRAWTQSRGRITFVSYLFGVAPKDATTGLSEGRYWGPLPKTLFDEGVSTNWLHIYVKDRQLPTARHAVEVIHRFNRAGAGLQHHVALECFLSVVVVLRALRDWFQLASKGCGLKIQSHVPRLGRLDLWPLFKDDWDNSVIGVVAISNALRLNLFEAAFSSIQKQHVGVYLLENQGWEYGMLQAWHLSHHERIVGCQHSTVRFWDLRYFFDRRGYYSAGNSIPRPDLVAVNGKAARDAYLEGGYPAEELADVEALRYLDLTQFGEMSSPNSVVEKKSYRHKRGGHPLRLLVLGDYTETHTRVQMRLLNAIADILSPEVVITVKPHPACPVDARDYPRLSLVVRCAPIAELLGEADIAYSSAVTSAAVDAYCAGVPVITVLDQATLNMSPLRGCKGVAFVGSADELAKALVELAELPRPAPQSNKFFNLNPRLPAWKALLGVAGR